MSDADLIVRLDACNESIKALGDEIWVRGPEWQELANRVYQGAKQVWIASGILRGYVTRTEKMK